MSNTPPCRFRRRITHAQLESIRNLNARNKTSPPAVLFRGTDVVDVVDDNHPEADMITGQWFGLVIGVLPDGSRHS